MKAMVNELPKLKVIVVWGTEQPEEKEIKRESGDAVRVFSWKAFLEFSKDKESADEDLKKRMEEVKPGHCASLIYTSGTTGRPKAVMISHDNLIFEVRAYMRLMSEIFGKNAIQERIVSYLPLSHVAGMLIDMLSPLYLTATSASWVEISFAR
jgi:long-chain-fatty-acid--CoA ligase ACSBG